MNKEEFDDGIRAAGSILGRERDTRHWQPSRSRMYWERSWRRQHEGYGIHPEDHFWRAANGLQQIEAALAMTDKAPS